MTRLHKPAGRPRILVGGAHRQAANDLALHLVEGWMLIFALVIGRGPREKMGVGGPWGFPSAGLAVRLSSSFGPVGRPRI